MNDHMMRLMREATRLTQSGKLREATAAIQRTLGGVDPLRQTHESPFSGQARESKALASLLDLSHAADSARFEEPVPATVCAPAAQVS